MFTGAAFDADNTTGATITGSSSKLGFNGEFAVSNAGDNNVTAGENVTDLTVSSLEAGMVDAGAAETVDVNVSAGNTANVTANGDVALDVSGATDLNLTATADATVDLTAAAVDTIVGAGEGVITLNSEATAVSADEISGIDTVALTSLASGSGAISIDASEWDVNTIDVAVDLDYSGSGSTLDVADGANVELTKAQSGLTVNGSTATNTATVSSALSSVGSLTFANLAAATLNLSAANAEAALINGAGVALDINVTDGAEIADLDGSNLTIAGAGDVTVADGSGATVVDASALDGALDLTSTATGTQEIAGGQGNNDVTFGATVSGSTATYAGQSGDDKVTFGAVASGSVVEASFAGGDNTITLAQNFAGEATIVGADGVDTLKLDGVTGTVAANLGAGDDVVELGIGSGANTYSGGDLTLAFGEGEDTLKLAQGVDLSNATVEITGLEALELTGASGSGATFDNDQLNGIEATVTGDGYANTSLFVTGGSVDLSGLTVTDSATSGVKVQITGSSGADTIVGTDSADVFNSSAGADTITLGGGADSYVLGAAGDSTSGSMDSIVGFDADEDSINLSAAASGSGSISSTATDISSASGDFDAALDLAAAGSGSATSIANWFQFDGNTYVVLDNSDSGSFDVSTDSVVELQGLVDLSSADITFA